MNIKTFFFFYIIHVFLFSYPFILLSAKPETFPPRFMVRNYVNAIVNLVVEVDLGRPMAEELSRSDGL